MRQIQLINTNYSLYPLSQVKQNYSSVINLNINVNISVKVCRLSTNKIKKKYFKRINYTLILGSFIFYSDTTLKSLIFFQFFCRKLSTSAQNYL